MKTFLFKPLLGSGVSLITLFILHYILVHTIPFTIRFSIFNYYMILTITTLSVVFLSLIWFFKKPDQLNAGFLFGSVIKMMIVVGYVFLILDLELKTDKIHIISLYILSLFIEIFFIGRKLNERVEKK